jgi:NAD(P)-dependent dehydrogenase (short-subunit alcohol dehydrogenase family)
MATAEGKMIDVKSIFDLSGKVALVTGGGAGLGRGIAEGFAQFGANVSIVDYNLETAQETVSFIEQHGSKGIALQADVSKEKQAIESILKTISHFGKIDILAAIAGIGDRNPAEKMTMEQWDRVININLKGVWIYDQEVGKHMIERGGGGSIINMASVAGLVGITTGNANYAASKGGVIALTRLLAIEWAKYNIRVNAIAPVQFKTDLIKNLMKQKPETEQYFVSHIPIGRMGEVPEIVGPAVFLASQASSMVTGHVLAVDGGNTVAF